MASGEVGLDSINLGITPDAEVIRTPFGSFTLEGRIGRGAFAHVYKAFWAETSMHVAVKKFDTGQMSREVVESVLMEVNLLGKLKHPNILRILGYHKENENLYIMLDYAENGSLLKFRKELPNGFPEDLVCMYTEQVLRALVYLHECGVIHRDLKAANILLMQNGDVKLADFGVAAVMGDADRHYTIVGSPYWMAPEVINATGHGPPSDIWSLACTIHELMTGEPPYFGLNPMTAMFKIVQNPAPIPQAVSPVLKDFMEQCFTKDPLRRPTAAHLLSHQWFDRLRSPDVRMSTELVAVRKAIAEAASKKMPVPASSTSPPAVATATATSTGSGSGTPEALAPVSLGSGGRSASSRVSIDGSAHATAPGGHHRRTSKDASPARRASTLRTRRHKLVENMSSDTDDDEMAMPDLDGELSEGSTGSSFSVSSVRSSSDVRRRSLRAPSDGASPARPTPALKVRQSFAGTSPVPDVGEPGSPPMRASSNPGLPRKSQSSREEEMAREIENLKRRLSEMEATSGGSVGGRSSKHTRSLKPRFVLDLYASVTEAPPTTRVWSMFPVGSTVWVGSGDGVVAVYRATTLEQLTVFRLHRTRIFSMVAVGSRVWCSSEEGDIYSVNPRATAEVRRYSVHDTEHRVIKCMAVLDPDEHARIWSCAPSLASSQVVVLNKRAQVKFRLNVRQPISSISFGPGGSYDYVWIGCIGCVLICDAAAGEVRAEVPLPDAANNKKVSQLLPVGDFVWVSAGRQVYVLDRETKLMTTIALKNEVERLYQMHNIILCGDSEGQVQCYDPLANALVHTLLGPLLSQVGDAGPIKAIAACDVERDLVLWTGSPVTNKLCVWRLKPSKH